jgi:WD40 repeat protein
MLEPLPGLVAFDSSELIAQKQADHMAGTREWLFKEVMAWLEHEGADAPKLFWVVGQAGVGKTVVTAELLRRLAVDEVPEGRRGGRPAAHHFFRHNVVETSEPARLIQSLAAQFCTSIAGFKDALAASQSALGTASAVGASVDDVYDELLLTPLNKLEARAMESPRFVVVLDALDELTKAQLGPILELIVGKFVLLPDWMRLFVTSRHESRIEGKFERFSPCELHVDDVRNAQDVRAYLASMAQRYIDVDVKMADVELSVRATFGIDMGGAMAALEEPMRLSKLAYDTEISHIKAEDGFSELVAVPEARDEALRQDEKDFDTLFFQDAPEAQALVTAQVATHWEPLRAGRVLPQRAKAGDAGTLFWVDEAIDPGTKGEPRSREKLEFDYDGDAGQLKDLARLTFIYNDCNRLMAGLRAIETSGWKVLQVKNKYAFPTPMGYRDFNLCVQVTLANGKRHICEMQLNHSRVLLAKGAAHAHYEKVRAALPPLCADKMDAHGQPVDAEALEAHIVQQLNSSALDAAVRVLDAKAGGLFLYARLLEKQLAATHEGEETRMDFQEVTALPGGLDDFFNTNFRRAFPSTSEWLQARDLVAELVCAMEPLPLALLGAEQRGLIDGMSLLFPTHNGRAQVLHKSVADWLSDRNRCGDFFVVRSAGHERLAVKCLAVVRQRVLPGASTASRDEGEAYALAHGAEHGLEAESGDALQAVAATCLDLRFVEAKAAAGQAWQLPRLFVRLRRALTGDPSVVAQDFYRFVSLVGQCLAEVPQLTLQFAANFPTGPVAERACAPAAARRLENEGWLEWRNKPERLSSVLLSIGRSAPVRSSAWLDNRLAVAVESGAICLFDSESGALLNSFDYSIGQLRGQFANARGGEDGSRAAPNHLTFSPDGSRLAVGGDVGVKIFDVDSGDILAWLQHGDHVRVLSVSFSPDGERLASCGISNAVQDGGDLAIDGRVLVFNLGSNAVVLEMLVAIDGGKLDRLRQVAYSTDGTRIVVCGAENEMCKFARGGGYSIFDAATGSLMSSAKMDRIKTAHFSQCGRFIVAAGSQDSSNTPGGSAARRGSLGGVGGLVCKFDADSGELLAEANLSSHGIKGFALCQEKNQIAACNAPGQVYVLDASTFAVIETYQLPSGGHSYNALSFAPSGDRVAVSSSRGALGAVCTIQLGLGTAAGDAQAATLRVMSIAISGDASHIAVGDQKGGIRVYDAAACNFLTSTQLAGNCEITSLCFSPDGCVVASAGSDGYVHVFCTEGGGLVVQIDHCVGLKDWCEMQISVTCAMFSPCGKIIVSAGGDCTVKLSKVNTGEVFASWHHTESLNALGMKWSCTGVGFSPDGSQIVSCGTDGTVSIVTVDSWEQCRSIDVCVGEVSQWGEQIPVDTVVWVDNRHVATHVSGLDGAMFFSSLLVFAAASGERVLGMVHEAESRLLAIKPRSKARCGKVVCVAEIDSSSAQLGLGMQCVTLQHNAGAVTAMRFAPAEAIPYDSVMFNEQGHVVVVPKDANVLPLHLIPITAASGNPIKGWRREFLAFLASYASHGHDN